MANKIDVSKEACAARLAYRTACEWCFQAVLGTFEEYEAAVMLRWEAFGYMQKLGLVDETMWMLEQTIGDDLSAAIHKRNR